MLRTVLDRRPLRTTAAVIGAVGLMALAAAPASADGPRPGLVLGPQPPVDGVKPGSSFEVPGTFANKGTTVLDKVYLAYSVTRGLAHQELPSNCVRYEVVAFDEAPSSSDAVCEFDQTVKAGAVYAPEKALSVNVLGHALYDTLRVSVASYDPAPSDGVKETEPGTGPAVKLTELPSTTPVGGGDPAHPDWDGATVPVTAVNTADFQVTGARLTGRVRNTVTLNAKFTNAGPAWVKSEMGTPVTQVLVKMPAGTTVTKASGYCNKVSPGSYSCGFGNSWIDEGSVSTFTFSLHIDKAVPGARGSVALEAKARPFDKNKKNDTAAILLDVEGAGSTGGSSTGGGSTGGSGSTSSTGGSGSASTGGSGATGGSGSGGSAASGSSGSAGSSATGGDLASTGSGSALPLAGAAAATLAAGAGTVLLVRRRAARR
ncbi:hypothetical protein [Streptomyces sp. NBC_00358]|uniref:hypothetical protein n=1 Tax=Streptomyces sp. NBC_00358 TaxID=2975725 RepID=UPI002E26B64D